MTSFDHMQSGSVINYPFLWFREADRGETDGRKMRPTAVALRLKTDSGIDPIVLLAITSKQPTSSQAAMEIPESEKRRAGLDHDKRLWVVLDEYNSDTVGQSFYIALSSLVGHFGKTFFLSLLRAFAKVRLSARHVERRE